MQAAEVGASIGTVVAAAAAAAAGHSLLMLLNSDVTLRPNSQPAPRGDTAQVSMSSGSLHIKSQKGPSWGISHTRSIVRICGVVENRVDGRCVTDV